MTRRIPPIVTGKQKNALIQGGLSGEYSSSFAKFVAVNCTDMVDKSEVKSENEHNIDGPKIGFALDVKPEDL